MVFPSSWASAAAQGAKNRTDYESLGVAVLPDVAIVRDARALVRFSLTRSQFAALDDRSKLTPDELEQRKAVDARGRLARSVHAERELVRLTRELMRNDVDCSHR